MRIGVHAIDVEIYIRIFVHQMCLVEITVVISRTSMVRECPGVVAYLPEHRLAIGDRLVLVTVVLRMIRSCYSIDIVMQQIIDSSSLLPADHIGVEVIVDPLHVTLDGVPRVEHVHVRADCLELEALLLRSRFTTASTITSSAGDIDLSKNNRVVSEDRESSKVGELKRIRVEEPIDTIPLRPYSTRTTACKVTGIV